MTATPTAGATPLLVQFNATVSSGVPSAYDWSFGDGSFWNSSVPGADRPFHRYSAVGLYVASVLVNESGCAVGATVSLAAVAGPLLVTLSERPTSGPPPLTVEFNSTVSGGTGTYPSASWSFGDGGVGSGLSVAYTYETPGEFTAILNVTDSAGHWAVAAVVVNVTGPGPSPQGWINQALPYAIPGAGALAAVAVLGLYLRSMRHRKEPDSPASGPSSPERKESASRESPNGNLPGVEDGTVGGPEARGASAPVEADGVRGKPPEGAPPVRAEIDTATDRLRLTQRTILHIGRLGTLGPNDVAPLGLTQAGMADALGVSQNSLSNVLRRLVAAGVLSQEVRHVSGRPRRLRVYRFTSRGETIYRDLRGTRNIRASHPPPR
ncbi:MAG TPA: PKD domain-containing protein [Thermoplasmata archaeon]|nr:PKD domain-containing protein [Thermoplasmata archaeon]